MAKCRRSSLPVEAHYRGQRGEIYGDLLIEDENEIRENGGENLHGTGQAPARGVRSKTGPPSKVRPARYAKDEQGTYYVWARLVTVGEAVLAAFAIETGQLS
jgi:hypothetical protein